MEGSLFASHLHHGDTSIRALTTNSFQIQEQELTPCNTPGRLTFWVLLSDWGRHPDLALGCCCCLDTRNGPLAGCTHQEPLEKDLTTVALLLNPSTARAWDKCGPGSLLRDKYAL